MEILMMMQTKDSFPHNGKFTWGVLKINIIRNIFHKIFHINT